MTEREHGLGWLIRRTRTHPHRLYLAWLWLLFAVFSGLIFANMLIAFWPVGPPQLRTFLAHLGLLVASILAFLADVWLLSRSVSFTERWPLRAALLTHLAVLLCVSTYLG